MRERVVPAMAPDWLGKGIAGRARSHRTHRRARRGVQLLAQHFPQLGHGQRLIATAGKLHRTLERGIDHGLIPDALGLRAFAEVLDHLVVEHDGDARLAWRGRNRAPLAATEIIFLAHGSAPPRRDWPCARR